MQIIEDFDYDDGGVAGALHIKFAFVDRRKRRP
jgi:hypothetical protein